MMEPFSLSLQQVNLEEKDITENDALESFSNLFSFDSDFSADKSNSLPVIGRLISRSKKPKKNESRTEPSSVYDSEDEVFQVKHHLVGSITAHTSLIRRHGDTVAIEPSGDSFEGFTDTVQALALQKSVIGNRNLTPASEDQVAHAIAEARKKIMLQSNSYAIPTVDPTLEGVDAVPLDQDNSSISSDHLTDAKHVMSEYRMQKSRIQPRKLSDDLSIENSTSDIDNSLNSKPHESISSISSLENSTLNIHEVRDSVDNISLSSSVSEQSDSLLFVGDNGAAGDAKELIQIPGDQLTKEVKKKSSRWFGRREVVESNVQSRARTKKSSAKSQTDNFPLNSSPIKAVEPENIPETTMEKPSLSLGNCDDVDFSSTDAVVNDEEKSTENSSHKTLQKQIVTSSVQSAHSEQSLSQEVIGSEIHIKTRNVSEEHSLKVTREVNVITEILTPPRSQTSRQSTPNKYKREDDVDFLRRELDKVLREKAKLEGQIEILQNESSQAIRDRTQLQAQVATLQEQTKAAESSADNIKSERDAINADMETLRLNRSRLEHVIMNAKKLVEDKDSDMRLLADDLKLSHEANEKLQAKVKDTKIEVMNKNAMIQDLKSKIAELYVDFQMSNQNKILGDSEIKSLLSEIKSLSVAKQWYQEQLQLSQEAKAALQRDVSAVKSEMIAQTTLVERLKADNIYIKQQFAEAEQRALSEKEKLARHLEAIESHMMEREATFAQLQHQKESIEATLQQRIDTDKKELSPEFADELRNATNELRRRQAHISILEHEQADLVKRLTLSQESILDRDRAIEALNRKSVEIEVQLQRAQLALKDQEQDIIQLKDEKLSFEVETTSLKEEKLAIMAALGTLKADMSKVEKSFKQLKNDLKVKQSELDQLRLDNNQLMQKLEESEKAVAISEERSNLIQESLQTAAVDQSNVSSSEVEQLQKNVAVMQARDAEMLKRLESVRSESNLLIEELKSEKELLVQEVILLRSQVNVENHSVCEPSDPIREFLAQGEASQKAGADWAALTESERASYLDTNQRLLWQAEAMLSGSQNLTTLELTLILQSFISQTHTLIKISTERTANVLADSLQNSNARTELEHIQSKFHALQEEFSRHKEDSNEVLVQYQSQISEYEAQLVEKDRLYEQASATVTGLKQQLISMEDQQVVMEQMQVAMESERDGLRVKLDNATEDPLGLNNENSTLRSRVANLETESHREIARQKAKALKLGKDLEAALKTTHQQRRQLDATVAEYESRLSALLSENTDLAAQLQDIQHKFTLDLDEKTVQLQNELHEVRSHYEERSRVEVELRELVQRHEVDMSSYLTRIEELQQDLYAAEDAIERYQQTEEEHKHLMLDLEREKGRLVGALQSHTALKEHTSSLEVALAKHESSTVLANAEVCTELDRAHLEINHLTEQVEQLEISLDNERQNIADTKKQLKTERESHVKVRRQLESLFLEHDQLKLDVSAHKQSVVSLTEELNKVRESDRKHRTELEHLSQEVRVLREDRDMYYPELEARRNKETIISEQIKSLEWQVQERDSEIRALKEQLTVIEQRQQMETDTLSASLQKSTQSLNELRQELLTVKQEKTHLLSRVTELRGALQTSLQHTKNMVDKYGSDDKVSVNFDLSSLENLLKDQSTSSVNSKPLSFLQATLSNLRGEIGSLQSQVDLHSHAVQTTSKAWKELESQVRDLREVCKSSAADREESQKLLEEGKRLAQNLSSPADDITEPDTVNLFEASY